MGTPCRESESCSKVITEMAGKGTFHKTLQFTRPLLIAHRGCSGIAPENTIPSFQKALDCGADVLEMDVHLTSDGELIVAHDATGVRYDQSVSPMPRPAAYSQCYQVHRRCERPWPVRRPVRVRVGKLNPAGRQAARRRLTLCGCAAYPVIAGALRPAPVRRVHLARWWSRVSR